MILHNTQWKLCPGIKKGLPPVLVQLCCLWYNKDKLEDTLWIITFLVVFREPPSSAANTWLHPGRSGVDDPLQRGGSGGVLPQARPDQVPQIAAHAGERVRDPRQLCSLPTPGGHGRLSGTRTCILSSLIHFSEDGRGKKKTPCFEQC